MEGDLGGMWRKRGLCTFVYVKRQVHVYVFVCMSRLGYECGGRNRCVHVWRDSSVNVEREICVHREIGDV